MSHQNQEYYKILKKAETILMMIKQKSVATVTKNNSFF